MSTTMKSVSRIGGTFIRSLRPVRAKSQSLQNGFRAAPISARATPGTMIRTIHSSKAWNSIMPDAENPAPPKVEASEIPTVPTDISTSEYNARADAWMDELVHRLEQQQDKRPDLEVDYSAGVLEISLQNQGTYVLNKQPPNKQIWLSSPVSGPKRFDWVVMGEGMDQKEGAGIGDWIYLRDGTSLTELIRKELGVELSVDGSVPE